MYIATQYRLNVTRGSSLTVSRAPDKRVIVREGRATIKFSKLSAKFARSPRAALLSLQSSLGLAHISSPVRKRLETPGAR